MSADYEALVREHMDRLPYEQFMEWKANVFDKIIRDDGKILTLHQALHAIDHGEADWKTLTDRVGRDYLPYIFEEVEPRLTDETFIEALLQSWTGPDAPEACLPQEDWIQFFRQAGFTRNGKPAAPPTEPVVLVRGGLDPDRMSWTTTPSVALSFAERSRGQLWATEAPPEAILAVINHERPGEDEWVIDPELVEPVDITGGVTA